MNTWSGDTPHAREPLRVPVPQTPCFSSIPSLPKLAPISFQMRNPRMLASMYNSNDGIHDPRPMAMLHPDINELVEAMNGLQSIRLLIKWPGYPDHVEKVSLRTPDNKRWETRLALHAKIARAYEAFFAYARDFYISTVLFSTMTEIRKIGHDRSGMPAELWDLVLKELPAADAGVDEDHRAANIQLMQRRKLRNTEILRRIADDTQFALIVERMTVRVHRHNEGCKLDIDGLISAVKSLPHIWSFRLYGCTPSVTTTVLDALAGTCGATLTELLTTTTVDLGDDTLSSKFKSLQVLSLEGNHLNVSQDAEVELRTWIRNAPNTLLHLSVSECAVWDTPLRVFSRLHELSLYDPLRLSEFVIVLEHCLQLRTLNIFTNSSFCEAQLHWTVSHLAPDSLPHLTSFRFVCGDNNVFNQSQSLLTAFIRDKKDLRRLDLEVSASFIGIDDYTHFLDVFACLPQLEIVGLRLRGKFFTQEHLRLLDERLPLRLSALLLVLDFPDGDVPMRNWTAMLKKRHLLGYLHVMDITPTLLDLRDALLKEHPPALQLVGYGTRLDWIQRDSPIDEAAYGTPWKDTTVAFRTAEDFGYSEDWEWLVRSHLYSY
ncbi:uncharacterized protein TRAVEDRAFT_49883 [Trametes versicolor FP-101664 SS1]|uniref:uncharacterized protein n=1 Tax=Trametes versicolor (strain FP-101664) TaxID=717944 RepID=UPI00046224AC|nr:uncharacterized protein TRAVEDRAFT_49883 [Trametes versicolor FP-101664 SS1]EIW57073.1 hypothetical protein TRAVEDRAFT_49883 [Trametes versicolor FP-101664 SS1]